MINRISHKFFAIIISIILISFSPIHARTNQDSQKKKPEVKIKDTEFFTLSSSFTNDNYEIYVSLPFGYEKSDTTYPVAYLLDGDVGFGMATDIYRLLRIGNEMPDIIMIGIAYGVYPRQKGNNRERDYTPTKTVNKSNSGGGENFLQFIQMELMPVIESNYKVNPKDRTILGVSLGGLFGLYVLFQESELFQRYIICSPSIWWDDKMIFQLENEFSKNHSELPIYLFLSVGSLENQESMILPWQELIKTIESREYSKFKMNAVMIDKGTHFSAQAEAIVKGLKFVFSEDNIFK